MGVEIERKFLVIGPGWKSGHSVEIVQGYLNRDPARTVRIRVAGESAFLTVKGLSVGATRAEFEYAIPLEDSEQLLSLCGGSLLSKTRHFVRHGGFLWEVDEFHGKLEGLVLAEVELPSEGAEISKPGWVGEEVTNNPAYYNSRLDAYEES